MEIEQRWSGWKRRALPSGVLVLLAVFVAAPGTVPHKLLWLMGGVCNLRPAHSYFAGGVQLGVCVVLERKTGISPWTSYVRRRWITQWTEVATPN
jgi:hypothetical protein